MFISITLLLLAERFNYSSLLLMLFWFSVAGASESYSYS